MMFSKEEQVQYNRHLILPEIGEEGQKQLKKAKILVVGAGGLGCPVLQYLTAAGLGTIGIVDGDVVSQSNLQRQVLFTIGDIGSYKVEVAKERLQKLNPFVNFVTFIEYLSKDNALDIFKQFDIVVDASDNFPTRYLVNDACVLTNKPLVFGSIFKFEGQVSVFNYQDGPTYRCLFPNPPKPNEVPNCSEIGVLGVLPGIIGCFQANEVLKMICGIGNVLSGKLLSYDALSMHQATFNFKRTKYAEITKLSEDYAAFCGVATVSEEITKQELESNKDVYNLLDVRNYKEREEYHIGGQHIPLDELEGRFNELKLDKSLVVYCKSGNRSKKAINLLQNHFTKLPLINLKGGLF